MDKSDFKVVAQNRKARHDYFILETLEAGLALTGTEIKSIREGKVSLQEGFARIQNDEAWLEEVYIAPYDKGSWLNPSSTRAPLPSWEAQPKLPRQQEVHRLHPGRLAQGISPLPTARSWISMSLRTPAWPAHPPPRL